MNETKSEFDYIDPSVRERSSFQEKLMTKLIDYVEAKQFPKDKLKAFYQEQADQMKEALTREIANSLVNNGQDITDDDGIPDLKTSFPEIAKFVDKMNLANTPQELQALALEEGLTLEDDEIEAVALKVEKNFGSNDKVINPDQPF